MATGPESLASHRTKRRASWKGKWANVERHNLQRPPSIFAQRAIPFSNSTRSGAVNVTVTSAVPVNTNMAFTTGFKDVFFPSTALSPGFSTGIPTITAAGFPTGVCVSTGFIPASNSASSTFFSATANTFSTGTAVTPLVTSANSTTSSSSSTLTTTFISSTDRTLIIVPTTTGTPEFIAPQNTILGAAPFSNTTAIFQNQTQNQITNQTIIPQFQNITVPTFSTPANATDPSAERPSSHPRPPHPTVTGITFHNDTIFHPPPGHGQDFSSNDEAGSGSDGESFDGSDREDIKDLPPSPPYNNSTWNPRPGRLHDLSDHSSSGPGGFSDLPSSGEEFPAPSGSLSLSAPLASKTLVDADRKRISTVLSTETLITHPESSTTWTETLTSSSSAAPTSGGVVLNPAVPVTFSSSSSSSMAAPVASASSISASTSILISSTVISSLVTTTTLTSRTLTLVPTAPIVAAPVVETTLSGSIVISTTLLSNSTSTTLTIPTGKHKDKEHSDDDSDDDKDKSGKPPQIGLDAAHKSDSSNSQATGISSGLSETAEHAVIGSVSIVSFALLCAAIWSIMRTMRNRKKENGPNGPSSTSRLLAISRSSESSPRTSRNFVARLTSKLPFLRNRAIANQQFQNLEAGTPSADSRSIYSNDSWPSLQEKRMANATVLPVITTIVPDGTNPIVLMPIPDASGSPISTTSSDSTLLPPTMPAAASTVRNSNFSWQSSQKSASDVSEAAAFKTVLQPMPATGLLTVSSLTDGSSTLDSYTSSRYTTELAHSASFRSAQAQYGGEETHRGALQWGPNGVFLDAVTGTGAYRFSELSSISSGFGDNDMILPPTNTLPIASRDSLSPVNMIAARTSVLKTPPAVAFVRESWSKPVIGQRDTVFTNVTEDSPPRFRTISSWVQQQTGRVKRAQHRAEKTGEAPVVPDEPQLTLMMPDGEVPRPVDMNVARSR